LFWANFQLQPMTKVWIPGDDGRVPSGRDELHFQASGRAEEFIE